jgi:ATP/maltotriose-dependent transcriptional regulator MalT
MRLHRSGLRLLGSVPCGATSLINDLETTGREFVLALDDYQFINSQAVHEAMTFLLEHCPHYRTGKNG